MTERPCRSLRRLGRDTRGGAAVDFAFVMPVLLALSLGILDVTLAMLDVHRAGEATRRGARLASIVEPVADLGTLAAGETVVCAMADGTLGCGAWAVANADTFDAIVATMQAALPAIAAENVRVSYSFSGIGNVDTPGGILPLATVELTNVSHGYLMLGALPGMAAGIDLSPHATSYLATSYGSFSGS